jgi:hypothetical protein
MRWAGDATPASDGALGGGGGRVACEHDGRSERGEERENGYEEWRAGRERGHVIWVMSLFFCWPGPSRRKLP